MTCVQIYHDSFLIAHDLRDRLLREFEIFMDRSVGFLTDAAQLLMLCFLLGACASAPRFKSPAQFTSPVCREKFLSTRDLPTDKQLDQVSELFADACFVETIHLGAFIREYNHDKFYSVSSEFLELFIPEGSVTPYVLESFERGYLSLLISLSYFNLHQADRAAVELRRADSDERAILYNYGDDPVIMLMQAAIFDSVHPEEARPFWKRLSEFKTLLQVQEFANKRIREIDLDSNSATHWKIYSCGRMPDFDWHLSMSRFYKIRPQHLFPLSTADSRTVVLSTSAWGDKIIGKYGSGYHPYLFMKGLMRLPSGLAYGAVGVTGGAAIGVGGCVIAAEAKGDSQDLCRFSLETGGYLISKSVDLVNFTLKPDLRHWRNLPASIVVSREARDEGANSVCFKTENQPVAPRLRLF